MALPIPQGKFSLRGSRPLESWPLPPAPPGGPHPAQSRGSWCPLLCPPSCPAPAPQAQLGCAAPGSCSPTAQAARVAAQASAGGQQVGGRLYPRYPGALWSCGAGCGLCGVTWQSGFQMPPRRGGHPMSCWGGSPLALEQNMQEKLGRSWKRQLQR
ncbi:hypothetical protein VULLAG_LOCUS12121 [Vulpes lagopus]